MVMSMIETTKTCRVCQRAKPLDAFYITKYGAAGRRGTCKVCTKIKARPARVDQIRRQNLKNYGMTIAEYDALFAAQDGRCAICDEPEKIISRNGQPFRLAVDHDHQTGAARGLLCALCNRMVGHLESRADMVSRMQAYLAQHARRTPTSETTPPRTGWPYDRYGPAPTPRAEADARAALRLSRPDSETVAERLGYPPIGAWDRSAQ